jgi:antirestriction protein ArdC
MKNDANNTSRQDVYGRITSQIVASRACAVGEAVERQTRRRTHHATAAVQRAALSGINILSLWMSAAAQGFNASIWMAFRQAIELNAHIRKGEKGSLVVYANAIRRTEHDEKTGEDEREIPS